MTRIVVHVDDVGFCQGANDAFVELSATGAVSAGSVMVPCPWFADLADRVDDTVDLGVHLTLNSEHPGYRWAPLTRPSPAAGLVDADGFMWRTVAELRANAHPDAVEAEWRAQLDRALAAGIDVTHLDAHMGSALAPEWCERYVALGVEHALPTLLTSDLRTYGPNGHLAGLGGQEHFDSFVATARAAGMPVFDRVLETDFARPPGTAVDPRAMLSEADRAPDDDLVYAALHPCRPGPGEVERIDPATHHVRVDEYALFSEPSWPTWLADQPFTVIGMRELRDAWRSAQ